MSIDKKIEVLSGIIAHRSGFEAEYFPIDRPFVEKYLDQIMAIDKLDFILCNLERVNNTYTVMLLACLPEVWEDIDVDDITSIINRFTNIFSYYAIIEFTYLFIEINIIDIIMEMKTISNEIKAELKSYLERIYPSLLKGEHDYFLFEQGIYGSLDSWMYIKQRLLLDERIKPALQSLDELKDYVENKI